MVRAAQCARLFLGHEERLQKLLGAYRHRDNVVLVLDTAAVMARYAAQTTLSPINSGFSARFPQPRGRDTFRSIAEYPFAEWAKKRGGLAKAVAECAVSGGVTNVGDALIETRSVPKKEIGDGRHAVSQVH